MMRQKTFLGVLPAMPSKHKQTGRVFTLCQLAQTEWREEKSFVKVERKLARNVYGLRHLCSRAELNVLPISMLLCRMALPSPPQPHPGLSAPLLAPPAHAHLECGIFLGAMRTSMVVSAQSFRASAPSTPPSAGGAACLQSALDLALL